MSLQAIDCVQRGVSSLRANWELALLQLIQGVLVGLLTVLGLILPLGVAGLNALEPSFGGFAWGSDPEAMAAAMDEVMGRVAQSPFAFFLALVGALLIWLVAFLVYSFFQGALFGILRTADRQAPSGRSSFEWFRTFTWREVAGWGSRYVWRYFWFLNFALLVFLLWSLVCGFVAIAAVVGFEAWGGAAALGIGCGGALPLTFVLFLLVVWTMAGQADLSREESGVWRAAANGARLVGHRLGATVLLFFLYVAGVFILGVVFLPLNAGLDLALMGAGYARLLTQFLMSVAQGLVSAMLIVAYSAAVVALVRGELTEEAPA